MSKFSFTVKEVAVVPKSVRDQSANSHPFPWDQMAGAVKASGKPQMFEVPKAYWIEERGMEESKYNATLAREKIRSTFKNWQSRDEARNSLGLLLRTTQEGIEVYLQPADASTEAAAKADEAEAKGEATADSTDGTDAKGKKPKAA
jgi:hypothetical protein